MARRASSVSELDQIMRVHGLLIEIGTTEAPLVEVTTASGTLFLGQLLRDVVGNKQSATGWSSYGSLMLATQHGKVEIDYLDIVSVAKTTSFVETKPVWLPRRRSGHSNQATRVPDPSIRRYLP